jgi:hypothetical protein
MSNPLPPGDRRHGTTNGYVYHQCSCARCRAAWAAYQSDYTARLRARGLPDGDHRHGTPNGYNNYGCRCTPCRFSITAEGRRQRATQTAP